MCKCTKETNRAIGVLIPSYIELKYNTPEQEVRKWVSVDICLIDEIWGLWEKGIVTTGCCCGHNSKTRPSYIGVDERFIPHMLAMGYTKRINVLDLSREDGFIPKSI